MSKRVKNSIIALLVISTLIGIYISTNSTAPTSLSMNTSSSPSKEQMTKLKDELSSYAIEIGKEHFSINLDYSEKSIKDVELILGEIHKEYARTKNEKGMNGVAAEFGAYIIKVIEKNYEAGVWSRDHKSIGEGSFPYEWRNSTIFPVSWCFKRIIDGEGDNIEFKYNQFIIEYSKKNPSQAN